MMRIGGSGLASAVLMLMLAAGAQASTVDMLDGDLNVNAGDGETNQITFEQDAFGAILIQDLAGATTADPNCQELDSVTVSCDGSTDPTVNVNAGNLGDTVSFLPSFRVRNFAVLNGGPGDDQLTGTRGPDTINGQTGVDTLDGRSGIDVLRGLSENDNITGGTHNDTLNGGTGNDTLNGGDGDDTLDGDFGGDDLNGGLGSDAATYANRTAAVGVYSGNGPFSGNDDDGAFGQRDNIRTDVERLIGGAGNDTIWAQTNDDDLVQGNGGNDELMAVGGASVFSGGPGTDTATYFNRIEGITASIGDGPNDGRLSSPEGDDVQGDVENLVGGAHDDFLIGDNDNNVLEGLNGADQLTGFAGVDTGSYTAISPGPGQLLAPRTAAVTIDIGAGGANDGSTDDENSGGARDNVELDVENLRGTQSGDTLIGSTLANTLTGGGGNDTLRGGSQADTLDGGLGDDTLDGGNSADVFTGGDGADFATYASRKAGLRVRVRV